MNDGDIRQGPRASCKGFKHLILRERNCQHVGVRERMAKKFGERKTREHGVPETKKRKCFLKVVTVSIAGYQAVMEFGNGSLENKGNLNGISETQADC